MNVTVTTDINKIKTGSEENDILVLITGDFCPDRKLEKLVKSGDYKALFGDFLPFSSHADISVSNLECPLTNSTSPIKKDGPVLKGPREAATILKKGGYNVISLANNHILDQGQDGLYNTIEVLKSEGLDYVGAGRNIEEALRPLFVKVKGRTIGFVSFAEVEFSIAGKNTAGAAPIEEIDIIRVTQEAIRQCDHLIMILHGGHEFYSLPSPRMKKLYRFFAGLGVSAIVGHHAHAFTGYELQDDVPVFYNIGNFLFDRNESRDVWYEGYGTIFRIGVSGLEEIYIVPYLQCKDSPSVKLLDQLALESFDQRFKHYNETILDNEKLEAAFNAFIQRHKIHYLTYFLGLNKFQRQLIRMKLYPKFLISNRRLLSGLSLARCQSHRDAFIEVLKQEIHKS